MKAKEGHEVFRVEGLSWRPLGDNGFVEANHVIRVGGYHGKIMTDHELGEIILGTESFKEFTVEFFPLNIDTSGGFIEDENPGILLEGESEHDSFKFSAGEIAKGSLFQVTGMDSIKKISGFLHFIFFETQPDGGSLVSHDEEFKNGEGHISVKIESLRDVADFRRESILWISEPDGPQAGNLPEDGKEEGAFSGSVGANDGCGTLKGDLSGNIMKNECIPNLHGNFVESDGVIHSGFLSS